MRAVVQRVSSARVSIDGTTHSQIGSGLVALVGVDRDDGEEDARALARRILGLRVFEDAEGRMNCSVSDVGGGVMIVSQFTLLGDCRKGNRPSFVRAAPGESARRLYEQVVAEIDGAGVPTATGVFRATMSVELRNEGPVTLLLDTARTF